MFHDTPNQYLQIIIYSDHQHIDKMELGNRDMELYNSKKAKLQSSDFGISHNQQPVQYRCV